MTVTTCAHQVQFYGADEALGTNVCSFLAVPLLRGEAAVVVATLEHRDSYAEELSAIGLDVVALRREGRYRELDAAATLASFMTVDGPDPARFRAVVGHVVSELTSSFGAIAAYGEMVGLLAADGRMVAALQVEALWSQLMSESSSFRLLCGYPRESFNSAAAQAVLDQVCAAHDGVAAAIALSAAIDLPLQPGACRIARRIVREICTAWGMHDPEWVDDVTLVVSELVANAIRHAGSRIALSLDGQDGQLTVSVTDGSVAAPVPRTVGQFAEDGRGMAIINALTQRWGVERQPRGKRVWAQLRACPQRGLAVG